MESRKAALRALWTSRTSKTLEYLASQQQLPSYYHSSYDTAHTATSPYHAGASNIDLDFDVDHSSNNNHNHYESQSSSPISTQSLLSQYSGIQAAPLSTFDSIPTIAVPRVTQDASLFDYSQSDQPTLDFTNAGLMQTETWLPTGQLTPRSAGRVSHQRESSLSSMGSTTAPASPYSSNTSNPHIALNDSLGDGFHGHPNIEDFHYNFSAPKSLSSQPHDTLYQNYTAYAPVDTPITTYPLIAAAPKRRNDNRGLLPPPDFPTGPSRSRPLSVASSVAGDSPATPSGEPEDDRRQTMGEIYDALLSPLDDEDLPDFDDIASHPVPKLERTITDIFGDELYSPNFTIASTPSVQIPKSPTNDMFAQRLQAANSQLLNVAQSPVSATSRDRSPFRNGSPLAPMPMQDFSSTMASPQVRFPSAHQIREQNKAAQDARALQQQMSRSANTATPQTISPKDAVLEFRNEDGDADFPLFPQSNSNGFDADATNKAMAQSQQSFDGLSLDTSSTAFNNYLATLPPNLQVPQVPQQYPFIPQRQQSSVPSLSNGSLAPSRMSSAEVGTTDSSPHTSSPQRPTTTSADGGTYTCTYHGCTLRFETPALLQKHKREGHRQAHGLNAPRRPDSAGSGMTTALLNSQAGPHKCDRINPSTGKPCNTIFSRPYDLTRHEDTIHNARKQKVRCDLCTDEKTFSRADALTRHYRVCHPDVEFHGKQRKRGGQGG
ncbi:hypothetical protein B0T19DRAFT_403723 [Cercophora scortea]|uniref:C2H2-type domain-containing protein n=1 Tax=Cercophora scortea TaxID=314031 RepID=A0AAE0IA45_9PEZI|nr:hypothetical protein B0T19DRAFT_403723 [Cercophora scortea]